MTQLDALLLTLALELLAGLSLARALGWVRGAREGARLAVAIVAASLLTHPFAWGANTVWLRELDFPVRATLIELSVVALEGVMLSVLQPMVWRRGWSLALVMNAFSFGVGLLIWYLG